MKQGWNKKIARLMAVLLAITVMGLFAFSGCKKKARTTTPTGTTTTVSDGTSETTEEPTTESATETTSESTTESSTEATTESTSKAPETTAKPTETTAPAIDEDGEYTSKDDVALYIHTYGHLPSNFVTKSEARDAGWEGGSLEDYFPGCSIGGDVFGNREGLLPSKSGRKYYECDIDTKGKSSRGAKRIVFSNDGLIYYTDDHYESFTLLYGEE